MKVNPNFLLEFQQAVDEIAVTSFAQFTFTHGSDPGFIRIVLALFDYLERKNQPGYNLPASTVGWTIDQFCQWCWTHSVSFLTQDIPAAYRDIYRSNMELTRPDGSIKRRSPFHINDANTAQQQAVRAIFLDARDCFKNQLKYPTITNPTTGYKSRGYWYNAALSSGLYYYTYFMQETLRIMFGPLVNDKYPFAGKTTPAWCSACNQCEEWEYTPITTDDFVFTTSDVVLPTGTYTLTFNTKAAGDGSSITPGDPAVLWVRIGVQGIDAEQEATGPMAYYTLNPIGPGWASNTINFDVGANTAGIYLSAEYKNGNGDYLLYFRNFQVANNVNDLRLLIYGAAGSTFSWTAGAGAFSFKQFTTP